MRSRPAGHCQWPRRGLCQRQPGRLSRTHGDAAAASAAFSSLRAIAHQLALPLAADRAATATVPRRATPGGAAADAADAALALIRTEQERARTRQRGHLNDPTGQAATVPTKVP